MSWYCMCRGHRVSAVLTTVVAFILFYLGFSITNARLLQTIFTLLVLSADFLALKASFSMDYFDVPI